jgi:hypothetical protein
MDLNGNYINTFNNLAEVEKELNISSSSIDRCCRKIRKTTHKFQFMYKSEYDILG